jgi:hypothetical protein
MISMEEKLLLLSLRILKVASAKIGPETKGLRVTRLTKMRMAILTAENFASPATAGNAARLALIGYLGQLAEQKLRTAL